MKIVYFTDLFLPYENGVTTSIVNSATALARHGHTLYIVYPRTKGHKNIFQDKSGIHLETILSIPSPLYPGSRISLPLSIDFTRKMREFDPDIIHFHTPFFLGSGAILLSKILRKPLIGTFHGYFMEPEYLQLLGLHKVKLDKAEAVVEFGWKYSDMFYSQADVILCPTETTKKDLLKRKFDVPIKVVSNGIDLDYIAKILESRPKKNYRLPEKYFVTTSRVSPEKSIDILIEVWKKVVETNNDIHLVIVGDGPAKKSLEKMVSNYGLRKYVHFLGMIKHGDYLNSNILRSALGFITTSKSETQGVSLMEAIAFGLPAIGVDARAIPELIVDNGIVCEPDNIPSITEAVVQMATDKQSRRQYSQASLKLIKHHSLEKSIASLEEIYSSFKKK